MGIGVDIYLLDIRAFLENERRGMLIEEAFLKLDEERGKKARHTKQERGLAASLGAGLLLQLAVRRAEAARAAGITESGGCLEPAWETEAVRTVGSAVTQCTVYELLRGLDAPLPFAYRYEKSGKPYLINFPYYFNLSHSGDYVACALSDREVGVDLQVHRAAGIQRVAGRFFSPAEADALMRAEDREAFFFRLWARKEAYGKLTGKGIADAIGKDLWSGGTELSGTLCWEEYDKLPGYSMAVCQNVLNGKLSCVGNGSGESEKGTEMV